MSKWLNCNGKVFDCKHCGMSVGWKQAKSGKYYTADVFSVDKSPVFQLTGQGKGFVAYHRCVKGTVANGSKIEYEKTEQKKEDETEAYWDKQYQEEEKKGEEKAYASKFAKECAEYLIAQTTNIPTEGGQNA